MRHLFFVIAVTYFIFVIGCSPKTKYYSSNQIEDGKYDSEYPIQPVAEDLAKIIESIKLVTVLAYYENFTFSLANQLKKGDFSDDSFRSKAIKKIYLNQPATGTATVVFYHKKKIGLLTCAHILNFPDTAFTYFKDYLGMDTEYVASITIKTRQTNNVIDLPQVKDFEIIVMDNELDLAIIGKDLSINPTFPIPVFNYKIGNAEDLNWGTHVYLLGFPRGKKMITSSIVSNPGPTNFLIDAAMPRGISGGIILALRDGVPNFELVGIANAVSAETEYYLTPDKKYNQSEFNPNQSYTGDSFIGVHEKIYYGVTHAISIESIMQFIYDNEQILNQKGYYMDKLFL